MSEQYALKNDGLLGPIPITENETGNITAADCVTYAPTENWGTKEWMLGNSTDVHPYVYTHKRVNNSGVYVYYVRDDSMQLSPSYGSIEASDGYCILCAVRRKTENIDQLTIRCYAGDVEDFVSYWNNNQLSSDGLLYVGAWSDYADRVEPLRQWDETPSTDDSDPENMEPQGGEFAETESFGLTDWQQLSELLEPETLDYGHFMTAYQLDSGNLVDIGDFLFDAGFWTSLKNKFEGLSDPLSMIISAVEIPFTLGVSPCNFKIGGVEVENGSGNPIPCAKHTSRYVKYTFGSITLKEVWGTAKDYSDCDISIFLPYVGMRQIDPDLGVNATMTLAAIIDVWTGDLNYMLEINNSNMQNKYYASSGIPYRWSGNCGNKIPIGKVDPSTPILNVAASLGSIAIGAGMFALSGGTAAPGVAAGIGAGMSGNAAMAGAGAGMMLSGAKSAAGDLANGFSPIAQSSGNISGAVGYMDFQYPYLVIKRGIPSYPANWRKEIGAPRYQEFTISDLSGYTEFAEIHADEISGASDDEKLMIEDILKAGVIL